MAGLVKSVARPARKSPVRIGLSVRILSVDELGEIVARGDRAGSWIARTADGSRVPCRRKDLLPVDALTSEQARKLSAARLSSKPTRAVAAMSSPVAGPIATASDPLPLPHGTPVRIFLTTSDGPVPATGLVVKGTHAPGEVTVCVSTGPAWSIGAYYDRPINEVETLILGGQKVEEVLPVSGGVL
jgi:hypothetical protein